MDHRAPRKRKDDPRDRAGLFSTITFSYAIPLFKKALRNRLTEDDLYQAPKSCRSEKCARDIVRTWERTKKKSSAWGLIWRTWGIYYLFLGVIDLTYHCFYSTIEPDAVSNLISYFTPGTKLSKEDAYYYAGILLTVNVLRIFYMNNFSLIMGKFSIQVRCGFSALLYRKIMRLSPKALKEFHLGNIVTIITKDVVSFENNVYLINDMILGSLECAYISYLIYAKMGPTSLIGIGIMIVVLPVQAYLTKLVAGLRLRNSKKMDERLQLMQETVGAIKIIKMYTWEKCFEGKIAEARRNELNTLLKIYYLQVLVSVIGLVVSKLSFLASILTYIYLGYPTTADFIYYVISCFNSLKGLLAMSIPFGWSCGAQMYAALVRITKVLEAEEIRDDADRSAARDKGVDLREATVDGILKRVNFSAQAGLVVVTGPVGCGKTVLLKTILEEFNLSSGRLSINGDVAYASQDPWLFPSTIKQNILFGEAWNEARYREVLRVCALEHDLSTMDYGENTIVIDRGTNLSKGQQARINLARAVYRNSDIYLLDDPLAALDSRIRDHVFDECIRGFLGDKVCILVTHTDKHVQEAHQVFLMDQGVMEQSTVGGSKKQSKTNGLVYQDGGEGVRAECTKDANVEVYREVQNFGQVPWRCYLRYVQLGGGFLLLASITVFSVSSVVITSYASKVLGNWVDSNQKTLNVSANNTEEYRENQMVTRNILHWYIGLVALSILMEFMMRCTELCFMKKSAWAIHKQMIESVINAVMSFFDYTFIGNILNRLSQDLGMVDEYLTFHLVDIFKSIAEVLSIMIIISTINWVFLVPSAFLVVSTVIIRALCIPLARSLRRLECTTRSPVVGHLSCTLEGLATIRSSKRQDLCTKEYDRHQDLYISASYLTVCTNRAFGFFLDTCCTFLLSFIVVKFLFFDDNSSAGNVGYALTEVMTLSSSLIYGIRNWTSMETLMTSLERVLDYTDIEQESPDGEELVAWPSKGAVQFKDVSLSYSKNENVLKHLNFIVEPRQKIGIVGRTGAGKSSILSVLFRLYEHKGEVLVDGVDLRKLTLGCLRQKISIIPQDPILFQGTMRFNVDPKREFDDGDIWLALEKVGLKTAIADLDQDVGLLSTGQRQLICVARAIIRRNKIVVLDEASANMDAGTEKLLDRVVRENFTDCTLIVIAHRLHSIIDADRILVLDNGEIVEFDSPRVLMADNNSYLSRQW